MLAKFMQQSSIVRHSGIDIVGDIQWGTHIAQLYSSKMDFKDNVGQFIAHGLQDNELCLWIYSYDEDYLEIKHNISRFIEDIDHYINSGQLIILPYTKWYIKDNTFNDLRINKQWQEYIKESIFKGFVGLRAVGNTSWLDKSYSRDFTSYEHNINSFISELPFIALCLYNVNQLDTFETAQIIKNHSYIITTHENDLKVIKNIELLIKDKQLVESQKKNENLIELLPDSVFIHDDTEIFYCNEAAIRLIDLQNANDLSDWKITNLVHDEKKEEFIEFFKKALMEDTAPYYFKTKLISSSGEVKDIEIITTKYIYQGYPSLISVVRDTTPFRKIYELKQDIQKNEELLKKIMEYDRIKNEFFLNFSHEFKTPLNVILSALQLLTRKNNQLNQHLNLGKYYKAIRQNCLRLLRLVNNIIDITKIDSNYIETNLQNYNLVELVENITLSVVEHANNKDINLVFDTDIEEKFMAVDPDQIERIMLNLLSNAIKFTPCKGSIWVSFYDLGDNVRIIVKDNGIGIPPEKQKTIFDRFQRVDNSLKKQHEGSGIGLSLVKALVERHKGSITLNSVLDKGSEFIVTLPFKILNETESICNFKNNIDSHNYVEKINIEFSDIYW